MEQRSKGKYDAIVIGFSSLSIHLVWHRETVLELWSLMEILCSFIVMQMFHFTVKSNHSTEQVRRCIAQQRTA